MTLLDKFNAALGKLVGPNAAHMIDGLIGVGLVGVVAYASSPASRVFLLHHAQLGAIVTVGIPVVTALASKFRKAAGSTAPLADQLSAVVAQAVKDAHAAAPAATDTAAKKA